MTDERRVVLGRVGGLYGVRGWVKLWSFTDPLENLLDYAELELNRDGRWEKVRMAEGRRQNEALVARFEGCSDRDQAARFVGAELAVERDRLPAPAEGEYYWADLVGLRVITTEGVELGVVENMMATGANDVMVVKGERERLLPFLPGRYVNEVDLAGGRIVVDWDPDF
ncbi:ribosome maturation factor RimM [Wenzhouxiangella sp. XN24]|uniref:ribosome maturation factor RimM n=1 Tax=Wenzhouxiangella sp. XN24 TaxID=2713569 RepID=UPI0013EB98E7|nr:ribosome maturation factor RimM [Wenzhouxiangella sp. XN24]NGX15473.1 ribosome maturation factor RimM [Wenzhouxiangella sp. XN24]